MVAAFELLGLLFILLVNTAIAALLTRFFRVRLNTQWGSAIYTVIWVPVVLLVVTMVLGSVLGPDLGGPATLLMVTVVGPAAAGVAFDFFWMPAPEEVDLPEGSTQRRQTR